jgi:hypothetical protein
MSTAVALHSGLIHLQQNAPPPQLQPPPQTMTPQQQYSPMALNTTNHQPAHMHGQVPAIFQMQ